MKSPNNKRSEASKKRVANQVRDQRGQFKKGSGPQIPPQANVNYSTQFVAIPNPINKLFYNPDDFFNANPENASRMLSDMAIWSALQERQLATCSLPWSICPKDEDDPEQQAAADEIEEIVKQTPHLTDLLRSLLDAIWFGRSAAYFDYRWDFSTGKKRMVAKDWTPCHSDSLIFGENGEIGYKVGPGVTVHQPTVSVDGRCVMLEETERECWIVHHFQKTAGEFRIFTSAGSIFGVGLRSRLAWTWQLKQELLASITTAAERFGAGWVIAYFDMSNPASKDAVFESLRKQVGSCLQMFPRSGPESVAAEGVEVKDPPSGFGELLAVVELWDKDIRKAICGQELTSEAGPTGLGSNLADVQQSTFGRIIKYDSTALQETLTEQFVWVLQQYNGFGHLPPLKFEFSFDLGDGMEKLEKAKILHDMGVEVSKSELLQAAGFTVPDETEEQTVSEPTISNEEIEAFATN